MKKNNDILKKYPRNFRELLDREKIIKRYTKNLREPNLQDTKLQLIQSLIELNAESADKELNHITEEKKYYRKAETNRYMKVLYNFLKFILCNIKLKNIKEFMIKEMIGYIYNKYAFSLRNRIFFKDLEKINIYDIINMVIKIDVKDYKEYEKLFYIILLYGYEKNISKDAIAVCYQKRFSSFLDKNNITLDEKDLVKKHAVLD